MFELLASIYDEVKRLGFKGEAKVIKSWISLKLPHLREEALLVEDLFGLYQSVSTLPPQHVPKHVLTLRELSYSTAGKNVRQIIGEIGYILNSIYSRGYLKHNLLNMPDELRQRHIQFGVLLKDIVGLLGIYYNVSNKDEMIEEELSQVVEMYNTSIVSMLNKLSQELSSVEGATKQMLKGEANRHFLEENSEIAQKAEGFFKQIQELLLVIRSTFYHVRSKITSVNLKEVMVVLKQLRDFLRSLDELDSSLDFKNHNYSPQALAYWSVVFTKSKRKKTTKRLQRQQIVREMEEKPYLEDYSNVVEVSSQLLNTNAKNIMQSYRELNAYITTLIELNEKVYTSILNLASLETKIQGIIARLETLKTRVNLVKEDRNLTKAQKIKEVSSNLGYNLQNLFKQMREVFDSKLNFDDLLSFPYVPEIQRYQELSKILKGTINNLYEKIWMGPLDRDEINKFYSWILIIYQKLKEVSDNPIMHFEGYEKQLQEVF